MATYLAPYGENACVITCSRINAGLSQLAAPNLAEASASVVFSHRFAQAVEDKHASHSRIRPFVPCSAGIDATTSSRQPANGLVLQIVPPQPSSPLSNVPTAAITTTVGMAESRNWLAEQMIRKPSRHGATKHPPSRCNQPMQFFPNFRPPPPLLKHCGCLQIFTWDHGLARQRARPPGCRKAFVHIQQDTAVFVTILCASAASPEPRPGKLSFNRVTSKLERFRHRSTWSLAARSVLTGALCEISACLADIWEFFGLSRHLGPRKRACLSILLTEDGAGATLVVLSGFALCSSKMSVQALSDQSLDHRLGG
jgi:hypothetical protein